MPPEQKESVSSASAPVTGYRLILPDDWAQIPLRHGTEEAVRHILDEAFSRIPPGSPEDKVGPYKRELERRFRAAVSRAQEGNALDLYLPARSEGSVNLGASIVVSETILPRRRGPAAQADPTDIAVQLLASRGPGNADLSSGELDGALAVRHEHTAPADPDRGAGLGSRRVEYIASVPDAPERWLAAVFSTVGGGDPRDELADALVEWFDAVMATLRWRRG
ncbi:hypothetical protein QFZ55_004856 [Streptomyces luteogriseus]|uniref:hypothetical protein n=1 Tax=Streptomyces luteogriseus TaxID=68233 RepID=UPI00278A7116|nr:hypothetical protein [Streptomyces luteogriseus]MDQ0715404.1 hypothetical protein [Streptomyces luteogriseus]